VNPDLGLTVTNNVNISITTPVLNATNDIITEVPSNTVITPRGTVLVGSNNQDPTTRIRLELFTTEPR
jgi:predicted TIM-barrel enzyme